MLRYCFFFIIFLFLGSFRDIALARFSFSKSDRENRKRDIFISETVIRGKLARRDKLGSCFKCRETRNEEEMSEEMYIGNTITNLLFSPWLRRNDFYRIKDTDPFSPRNVH